MFQYSAVIDKGLQKSQNDDRALAGKMILAEGKKTGCADGNDAVFAVCDGVGGYAGGGMAATIALKRLAGAIKPISEEVLTEALHEANEDILKTQNEKIDLKRMCTTVAGVAFSAEQTLVFHAGDSRVYRYRNGVLAQMTRDHTEAEKLISMGMLEDTLENRSISHLILRYLGSDDCQAPEIEVIPNKALESDMYLLCSDGLWSEVNQEAMIDILGENISMESKAQKLIESAKKSGGNDNITALLVRKCSDEGKKPDDYK